MHGVQNVYAFHTMNQESVPEPHPFCFLQTKESYDCHKWKGDNSRHPEQDVICSNTPHSWPIYSKQYTFNGIVENNDSDTANNYQPLETLVKDVNIGFHKTNTQKDEKLYYIANSNVHCPQNKLPKLKLKSCTLSNMPGHNQTCNTTKKIKKSFFKVKKKLEKELQVKINRKAWKIDKFSLIKARRNGSTKPEGLYRMSKPRCKIKSQLKAESKFGILDLEVQKDKTPPSSHYNPFARNVFSVSPTAANVYAKSEHFIVNLERCSFTSRTVNDRLLFKLFPKHFPKSLQLKLIRLSNTSISHHNQNHIFGKNGNVNWTHEHLNKLKMKLKSVVNVTKEKDGETTIELENHCEEDASSVFPPLISKNNNNRSDSDIYKTMPPILEKTSNEPSICIDNELENSIQDANHHRDGVYEESTADENDHSTICTESNYGNCNTLQVYVYQGADDRDETGKLTKETLVSIKSELPNKGIASLPYGISEKDVIENESPCQQYYKDDQSVPTIQDHARLHTVINTIPRHISKDGYDSDATVVYSDGEANDEEEKSEKSCLKETCQNSSIKSFKIDKNALKIRRTDKLYQFKGSIVQQINERHSKEIDLENRSPLCNQDTNISFKIPSITTENHKPEVNLPRGENKVFTSLMQSQNCGLPKINELVKKPKVRRKKKLAQPEEHSLTLTIFRKPKGKQELKKLQNRSESIVDNNEFGIAISEPDRKIFSKKKATKTPRKPKDDILSSINKVFPKRRRTTKGKKDEDELPKILPPKRRRLIKQANTAPTGTGMERIMQEFPRHNWLENKYLPEETSNDGNQTENSSSNQYQYELLHEQEEDTPISEIQPFSEERNRKEDVPNSSIIINTPERKESQINNITVDTDLNKSDVSTPTLPQDIVCYSTDNTERFPDKITEEHSSAAAYGASAVVDNKDSVEGETMKIQWKAFTNQQTSSESEPVQTNGTLCDNKGNTASSPSKISSIALDSDVGTVISITEDKNKDIHRATSQKHRDILPPVPKLIHATTLKSMTANKETLSPDEATYPQVTEQLHREVVNECKENTPESLEISSNDQCGIITKNEQTEESLLQSFAHKNNENNETSALSAMNEVKLCETSPRCAISSRSSPSTHAPLVSSKNASLHAVSNVKQEMEVINLSKSDAYRVPKKSFQIPMQSPIEEAKMMNSPARSNTNHVGRNEIDDSESFEKQAVSTSNDKHITYEKQNLEYAHASSQRDSPRIPLKAAIMKSYQPEVAMNKMTNCHVVPVVMPLQSSSPVQKDIRRPMVDQKQLDEALRYEKALQEYKTIEKMTQIKEKERNDLLLLKEKKYRELKTLQANVPIHPTVNTSVRLKPPINALVPPPAHQNKKENTLEILEKMAKDSHLVQPGIKNVANSFKSRQIPVLDPPEDIKMSSNSSCHSRSQTEMQNKPVHWTYIPTVDDVPSHNSAQSIVQTSRSSSAPAMYNNNKSPFSQYKTQINPTPQQNGNVVHEPNEFTLKGIKRLHSDEFVELRLNNVCAQEEQKIQEALNQAMVVKKQRMNAANSANSVRYEHINNNNHTNYAPANSQVSHQQFRKISAGISQYQQGHQNQNTIANGIRPDGALTKDLLIKGTPMANQIYDAQYVQRFPLNQTNIIRPSNTMPRQCRPQTVRLLGAAAQPRCTVPNNTIRAYQGFRVPLQTSLHPDHTGPRHMLRTTREQPCHNAIAQQNIAPSSVGYKYQYPVTTYPQATAYRPQPVTENKSLMSPHQRHSAHPCVQNLPSIAPQSTTIHPQHSTPMHMATSSTHNTTAHRLPVVHINSNNTVKKEDISVETHVTRMNGNCIICKKFALYLCSNCQQFWYCSPDCQLKHWVSHQNDCNAAISSQR